MDDIFEKNRKEWGERLALDECFSSRSSAFSVYRQMAIMLSYGISLADILLGMGINRIKIYGYGEIGKLVVKNLDGKIEIVGIYDAKVTEKQLINGHMISPVSMLQNDDTLILITPIDFCRSIACERIQAGYDRKKILSVRTLLTYGQQRILHGNAFVYPIKTEQQYLITGAQFQNKGAQAMLFTAISEIREKASNAIIWYLPVDQNDYYTEDIQKKYRFIALLDGTDLRSQLFEICTGLTAIIDVGGYVLTSKWSPEFVIEYLRIARNYDIPIYFMPQSFGPLDYDDNTCEILRLLLPEAKLIFAREKDGYNQMQEKFHLQNMIQSIDLVLENKKLYLDRIYYDVKKPKKINIGNKNSVAIIPNIRTFEYGVHKGILSLYRIMIEKLLTMDKEIYIVAHSDDEAACCDIYSMFFCDERVNLIEEDLDCIDFAEMMQSFEFAVVSRYHAAVQAYKKETPCIILGWAEKYKELAEYFEQSKYVMDVREEISSATLISLLEGLDSNKVIEAEKIKMKLEHIPEETCFNFLFDEIGEMFMINCNSTPKFYAAISKNQEAVLDASSGGVFWELCRIVINQGGVVFGAELAKSLKVQHRWTNQLEDAKHFRKSKYLRSNLGNTYQETKELLDKGELVLYSGVGCQIGGLYKYLDREYNNLITCEVVCHGAPISFAFDKYYEEIEVHKGSKLVDIDFRDKRLGWKKNCILERYENGDAIATLSEQHPLHSLYLKGINMEAGCGSCIFQSIPRIADITLADFWKYEGFSSEKINELGISLIGINTNKGERCFNELKKLLITNPVTSKEAISSCRHMTHTPLLHNSQKAFNTLIRHYDFHLLYPLFHQFGEIVLPCDCNVLEEVNEATVLADLWEDTQSIEYIVNCEKRLTGVITFGQFIQKYAKREEWINRAFKKVVLENGCEKEIQEIFSAYSKINRIPVISKEGEFLFEVRRYYGSDGKRDIRKWMLPFAALCNRGNLVYYVKRPDILDFSNYSERQNYRIENHLSFSAMQENILQYEEEWKQIMGENYSPEYIEDLCRISPIIETSKGYRHKDQPGQLINVIEGERVTADQPDSYKLSLHMYGRCGVFGYAVEDSQTLPSFLQKQCNKREKSIRVVNHGLWGGDDEMIFYNLLQDINSNRIGINDRIILYMAVPDFIYQTEAMGVKFMDTTDSFHEFIRKGGEFYDKPGHMTAEGYQFVADQIYRFISEDDFDIAQCSNENNYKQQGNAAEEKSEFPEIEEYITRIKNKLGKHLLHNQKNGAIVMNCNPFTKGHRYLIEMASKEVDILFVFVVEEDKSSFSFHDRLLMVKKGTEDLSNVYVFPSGNYIISSLTFPEYFTKEQNKETEISATSDVLIFAKNIAPQLNISIRFAGTEPNDPVTSKYNHLMSRIFPKYNIDFKVYPRLKVRGEVVSATKIREWIQQNNFEALQENLPMTTMDYLFSERSIYD